MYAGKKHIEDSISDGEHRAVVGGAWEQIGQLQLEILKAVGMKPSHRLLDIGCGSLRLGVRAVDYLDPEHYWGTDLHGGLLKAGYERELVPAGLAAKLPVSHLVEDGEFEFPEVSEQIDFAIATSVFTHLPLNHLRLCLWRLAERVSACGSFVFSVFLVSDAAQLDRSFEQVPGGPITNPHRDPYHYLIDDVLYCATGTGWNPTLLEGFEHPRGQRFFVATRR